MMAIEFDNKVMNKTITTLGTGQSGNTYGTATSSKINHPWFIYVATNGDIYFSEWDSHRIKKISGDILSLVAGTGSGGYSGDNGAATSAQIRNPWGLVLSSSGELYFAGKC